MPKRTGMRYQAPVALYNDPRRFFVEWIDPGGAGLGKRILDVGCACGDLGRALAAVGECELVGLEYDAGSVDVAMATGVYDRVCRVDLEDGASDSVLDGLGGFDVIVCGDVLEHLRDPPGVLRRLLRRLRSGGQVLVSLPNIAHASVKLDLLDDRFAYTERGLMDRTHLKFFTWRSIAELLDTVGLQVREVRTTTSPRRRVVGSAAFRRLPASVSEVVIGDPHSFVNQYVVNCIVGEGGDGPSNKQMLGNACGSGVESIPIHPLVRLASAIIPVRDWRRRFRERWHLRLNRGGRPVP